MSLDKRLLSRARARLEQAKADRRAMYEARLAEVYAKAPRVRELDMQIKSSIASVISVTLKDGGDPQKAVEDIGKENLKLQKERDKALSGAGFAKNYLDDEYLCPKCRDTGYDGAEPCSCLMEYYNQEQRSALSSLLKLGSETFESFQLDWYSDTPDPKTGISPRTQMTAVYEMCRRFALSFGKKSFNLFLHGAPGLGKTFLSASIARVVSDSGFSVVYDTATAIFGRFEDAKFLKSDDVGASRDEIARYLECDLLIVDDLGTELTTAFTVSALYEIINTRLISGKKTVINSNLSTEDMRSRYSPQIMSRLEGEYQVLTFVGRDIRLLKKEKM